MKRMIIVMDWKYMVKLTAEGDFSNGGGSSIVDKANARVNSSIIWSKAAGEKIVSHPIKEVWKTSTK